MRKYRLPHVVVLSIAVMLIMALSGCYRRVVGVKGIDSGSYKIYEPNYQPDGVEGNSTSRKMLPTKIAKPR